MNLPKDEREIVAFAYLLQMALLLNTPNSPYGPENDIRDRKYQELKSEYFKLINFEPEL